MIKFKTLAKDKITINDKKKEETAMPKTKAGNSFEVKMLADKRKKTNPAKKNPACPKMASVLPPMVGMNRVVITTIKAKRAATGEKRFL